MNVVDAVKYKKIAVPPAMQKRLQPALQSWRSVYPFIVDMEDTQKNLDTLASMLSMELNSSYPRHQIVKRLHMRINAMRCELERSWAMQHVEA